MRHPASAGGALLPQRDLPSVNREWPISERARWLPALAMAIGIIYGESNSRPSPVRERDSPDLDD